VLLLLLLLLLLLCVWKQQANAAAQCQQQRQHIHLSQPNINVAFRGRSLPNVNQMSSSSGIDLQVLCVHFSSAGTGTIPGATISGCHHFQGLNFSLKLAQQEIT